MLITGLRAAEQEAQTDFRRKFLHERAIRDLEVGYHLEKLRPGEQLVWTSPYPEEAEQRYGKQFVRDRGFFPERKMGFIYRAYCNADASVTLESQTVDRSDQGALAMVERLSEYDPEADMETLRRTYDGNLVKKYGGQFYAGRRGAEIGENAWKELLKQKDLIEYYVQEIERLAKQQQSRRDVQGEMVRLTIGVWKLFKKRLNGEGQVVQYSTNHVGAIATSAALQYAALSSQVHASYLEARANGEVKAGCGGAISALGQENESIDIEGTFNGIFGEQRKGKSKEETYSFDKKMYCVVCQAPPQKTESKKMCGPCGICKGCDTKMRTKSKGSFALAA